MSRPPLAPRLRRGLRHAAGPQDGVMLITVLGVILIVTLLVGALVLATMGETSITRQQIGSSQALFIAEGGAYRALGELRRRVSADLESGIGRAGQSDVLSACESDQGWSLVGRFGHTGLESDWEVDPATSQAVLALNGGQALAVLAPDGQEIGRFTATIRVRSAGPETGKTPVCRRGDPTTPESYQMFLAYEIVATGTSRNARRTVRLTNPSDVPVELFVERASFGRWAILLLEASEVWLTDTTVIDGPAHTNGIWWIWGRPTFHAAVSSVSTEVRFGNCGTPVDLEATMNAGSGSCEGDRPRFLASEVQRGVAPLTFPASPPNLARIALGMDPEGSGEPTLAEISTAAPDQVDKDADEVELGIYIANDSGVLRHPQTRRAPGIYVEGDVVTLALVVEEEKQAIIIRLGEGEDDEDDVVQVKVVIDHENETLTVAPEDGSGPVRTYRGTFNGLIYVNGDVENFFGVVHRQSQLTVAAEDTIWITDHLVYREPPAAGAVTGARNILGIYARGGDVLIDGEVAPPDLYVDAVVLAPRGVFGVEGFDTVPDKGTVHFFGGVIQRWFGEFGSFDPDSRVRRGYSRELRYDQRLLQQVSPPFFPRTDRYAAPRRRPDTLYEKPVWEEIPSP